MKVVAISGWARSGKDTAAKILIEDYGFNRIAFADPLKNTVAEQFGFERQSLDNQSLKETPVLSMPVKPKDPFTKMIAEFMIKEFRTKSGHQCESFTYRTLEKGDSPQFMGLYHGLNGKNEEEYWPEPVYWTRRALMMLEGSSKRSTNPDYWVEKAIGTARSQNKERIVISDLRYKNEIYAMKMALGDGDELTTVRVNRFESTSSEDPSERDLDDTTFDIVIENRGTKEEFLAKSASLGKWLTDPAIIHGIYT